MIIPPIQRKTKIHVQIERERHADPNATKFVIGGSIANHICNYELHKHGYANYGIGGDQVQNILHRAIYGSFPRFIQQVIIIGGTNNLKASDPDNIVDTLLEVGQVLKSRFKDVSVAIASILPRDCRGDDFRIASKRGAVNAKLLTGCRERGYSYINTLDLEGDSCKIKYFLFDSSRLHLNARGNNIFSNMILKCVNSVNKCYISDLFHASLLMMTLLLVKVNALGEVGMDPQLCHHTHHLCNPPHTLTHPHKYPRTRR